ncbi:helix-turn-helix domain-containing protein [Paludibacter jiangxiensis]|uniref:AraC family transcriptional regulator n=1 Tax=Paludibacter jiangxiensis TaxID=681398 RepID=A0A161LDV2_9BACT|nr:AraC family transcriptional regulator [Paludibacter jiangxiensis]GAT62525.1 AraC family transcriptional regulator [Paludibacter jiangxiensis]
MNSDHHLERIKKTIEYLKENPGKNMSLKEVASIAMFSEYHFHRIFKKVTGETPRRYIKRLRMEKACSYLKSDESIEIQELWSRLGYSTASHFSKDFRIFYGCTPSQYQKKIKEKKINEIKAGIKIMEHQPSPEEQEV